MNYKFKITRDVNQVSEVVELETDDKIFAEFFVESLNPQEVQPHIDIVNIPTELLGDKEKLDKLIDELDRKQQDITKTNKKPYKVYPNWPVYPGVQDWFEGYQIKPPFHPAAGTDKW